MPVIRRRGCTCMEHSPPHCPRQGLQLWHGAAVRGPPAVPASLVASSPGRKGSFSGNRAVSRGLAGEATGAGHPEVESAPQTHTQRTDSQTCRHTDTDTHTHTHTHILNKDRQVDRWRGKAGTQQPPPRPCGSYPGLQRTPLPSHSAAGERRWPERANRCAFKYAVPGSSSRHWRGLWPKIAGTPCLEP